MRVSLRTGSATDVVESELSDTGVELEEEGERLADTAGSTEDGDLGELQEGQHENVL
jgi:hypothetical protein